MNILPVIQADGLPNCQGCGACCVMNWVESRNQIGVVITHEEFKAGKIPSEFIGELPKDHNRNYKYGLKTKSTEPFGIHCIAWDPETHDCTIYENRPEKCVNFDRGNQCCKIYVKQIQKIEQKCR